MNLRELWTPKFSAFLYGLSVIMLGTASILQGLRINQLQVLVFKQTDMIDSLSNIQDYRQASERDIGRMAALIPILKERNDQQEAALKQINRLLPKLIEDILVRIKALDTRINLTDDSLTKLENKVK